MANPYASPFGNTSAIRARAAREDAMNEDDDLKVSRPSRQQSAFAQFKKLSAANSKSKDNDDSKEVSPQKVVQKADPGWSMKRSAKQKKDLNRSRSRNKKDKKRKKKRERATSVPKEASNSDGKSGESSEYIYFNDVANTKEDSQERPALGKKTNQFDALNVETSNLDLSKSKQLKFDSLSNDDSKSNGQEVPKQFGDASVEVHTASYRSVRIPSHRMVHVRRMWADICKPVVKHLKLQIRMNSVKKIIEIRSVSGAVEADPALKGRNAIQKGSDFIRAAVMGFELKDALALVRLDDIFLESFDIRDVKFFNKKADHWMRAIGRIAGQYGKIKYSIENSTNSRIIIFGFKVHILGSFSSIRLARNSISRLVIGAAPGNVYAKLRVVSSRLKHRF